MEIPKKKTICLNMIVKDEAHIILETLQNLLQYITFDYWVISDTGSTDGTQSIIQNFFSEKRIPGEIFQETWVDFGFNRTKALERAFNKTDYILIFDADDKIVGDFKLPKMLNKDRYLLIFGPGFSYVRPLLVTNRKRWCFKGVLHECLSDLEPMNGEERIEGDYYLISGRSGNRSKNPNKYFDDAIVLKRAFIKERLPGGDYGMACRYAFYCAQSYKDAGSNYWDNSIEWYKKVLTLDNWSQEKFYSCFTIGELYNHKKEYQNALTYWLKTIEYDSERIEGIVSAMEHCYSIGQHILVNVLYNKFKDYNKHLPGKLFLHQDKYNDFIEYYNSISSFYTNDKLSGYQCCKKILINKIVCDSYLLTTISNLQFYKEFLEDDQDTIDLFYSIDSILSSRLCRDSNEMIDSKYFSLWNTLFEKNKHHLTNYKKVNFNNRENVTVFLSMTTCKRLDLFKQTVNSILNNWLDLDKVDYWFCVDDNSSEYDRKCMKELYPWVDYHMKNGSEKGHRKSMNIIWNKIKELNPVYWIHIEDDFLFHTKMNYVSDAIQHLNFLKEEGVKQILFNRNYGEIIEHYNNKGHISIPNNDSVVIHEWKQGTFSYQNCHYWPHYSFRPSLIDVNTILTLGNFDTENQFFELDYANKWFDAGYKSAFFNKITNRHIGRLTSERSTQLIKNAYELNNEEQFVNKTGNTSENISIVIVDEVRENDIPIKIINLDRRNDRKEIITQLLTEKNITNYEFIKAVDGTTLTPTIELKNLFKGNDFGNRRGVIGCAISHLNLWLKLLDDPENDFYIIMEDDFTLASNFNDSLCSMKEEFVKKEVIFMGYHMFESKREKVKEKYDNTKNIIHISPLDQDLYIGGYFAYSINKIGANKLINYIKLNGIKHGIDYLNKIVPDLNSYECQPHIVFSQWNEDGKPIDTDIQKDYNSIDFADIDKKLAFFDNGMSERGTSVALYDYAYFNEKLLGNISYIFYEKNNPVNNQDVINKFEKQFPGRVYPVNIFSDIDNIIEQENIDILYLIKYGNNDGKLSKKCKNVVHCVFTCNEPHGEVYSSITPWVKCNNGSYPCVPHMIHLPKHEENMREVLGVPSDAIVFGRYGGYHQFDIPFVHQTIVEYAKMNPMTYFIFINTKPFCQSQPNIIYIDKIIELHVKVCFINTCDAMIHGRIEGETFGLSIAEFSSMNKPVITTKSTLVTGDNCHIELLGDKGIIYNNKEELVNIFKNIKKISESKTDWNAYSEYTPEKVMNQFKSIYIDELYNITNFDDFVFKTYKNDMLSNNSICKGKYWEPHITTFLKEYSNWFSIENMIDIGANFGYHSLYFSRIAKGTVYSFEPHPEIYTLLSKNVELNNTNTNTNTNNLTIFNCALGNKDDNVYMSPLEKIKEQNMGDIHINKTVNNDDITIECKCLDSFKFSNIDVIKIDVQGYELMVIEGAINILEIQKPLIIIEFEQHQLNNTDTKSEEIASFLKEIGYELFMLSYSYPSDIVCVHKTKLLDFMIHFSSKICKNDLVYKHITGDIIIDNKIVVDYQEYENFIFIPNMDQMDHDLYFHKKSIEECIQIARKDSSCSGFNTLGYFKNDMIELTRSPYFNSYTDGIYIKKEYYKSSLLDNNNTSENNKIRIKMLCNWCSSEQLCKEWSNMCESGNTWKNIEIVWDDTNIDYYVIINSPPHDEYYIPSKTLVFQMEPWVYDEAKPWGVKTWDTWASPDPNNFLHVHNHARYLNAVQWQITTPLSELSNQFDSHSKLDRVSSICSHKNQDEGHILRNQFIKYMDQEGFGYIDVYGKDNYHKFTSYKGPLLNDEKVNGFKKYKYYFMAENNSEDNYATEKIWEPILCECVCFYWGCPNLESYIDSQAFVRLDLTNKEESLRTIVTAMKEDWWTQRIHCIRREKQRILTELGFFPTLQKIIDESRKSKVIVSLTTIPRRIANIELTIRSLLNQSVKPDKIILNIPYTYHRFPNEEIIIPESLLQLVTINRCDNDYGPATKLLGLVNVSEIKDNDIVIVCDDDRIYDIDFVSELIKEKSLYPDYCICNTGWDIDKISEYTYTRKSFPRHNYDIITSGFVDVLGGCCGFALYKNQIPINDEFYNIDKTSPYFLVDDIWISGFLALNNIKIWHIYYDTWKDPIRTNNDLIDALSGLKDELKQNICNKHCIQHFRETYGVWKDNIINTYDTKYGLISLYKNDVFFCEAFNKGIYWDEDTLLLLKKYIDPTRNILEIGGHCGTSTIVYSSFLQNDSKIYVYEPQKNIFDLLVKNINQNKLQDKIFPINKGVFCYVGDGNMNDIDLDGGGGVVEKRYNEENDLECNFGGICLGNEGETIKLTTIDDMEIDNIGFIHCDAQGSETFIFSKAITTITRDKPVILFENNVQCGTYLYDNVCNSYPDYKEEGLFDVKKYCTEVLGYTTCIDRFNGSNDTLLIP